MQAVSPAGDPQAVVAAGKIARIERRSIKIVDPRKAERAQSIGQFLGLEETSERLAGPRDSGRQRFESGEVCRGGKTGRLEAR